jgi:hypothetical protein
VKKVNNLLYSLVLVVMVCGNVVFWSGFITGDKVRLDWIEKNNVELYPPGSDVIEWDQPPAPDSIGGWIACDAAGCDIGTSPDLRESLDEMMAR